MKEKTVKHLFEIESEEVITISVREYRDLWIRSLCWTLYSLARDIREAKDRKGLSTYQK